MNDLLETLSQKEIFIMSPGRAQQEFEYIFADFYICGYIDESALEPSYNGQPIKRLKEVLLQKNFFIIICEGEKEKWKSQLDDYNCKYGVDFCFSEDLFFLLDYDLQKAAGEREIVICGDEERFFVHRKPDLLLDTAKHGEMLYGMEIFNPMEFEEWEDYFIIVTVDKPDGIFSVLKEKGLFPHKNYAWYYDIREHPLPDHKRIAYYGCGYVALEILKRQKRHIARRIAPDELKQCNKEQQYVVLIGTVFDKSPILETQGYEEIKDFSHWSYIDKMETLKPSDLLRQTMAAPMLEQPHCDFPFQLAWIDGTGEVYGCICPGWVQWGFGSIKHEKCNNVWNSIYAKIFRLSIINRTFSFCKRNYCHYCNSSDSCAENTEVQIKYKTCTYPKIVKPSIDYSCNLFCQSCRPTRRVAKAADFWEIEFIAKRLMAEEWLEHAEELIIAGDGEVFYSQIYRKLLYEVKKKRNKIYVISNGNLFAEEDLEMLLQCYRFVEMDISVDAASKETYEKLRRGGDWDKLMRNLELLGKARANGDMDFFTISMVVQRENYQEIPEFIKLGKRIYADAIVLVPLLNWGTYSEEEYQANSMISHANNWISDALKEVLRNPLLEEQGVDYSWFQKRL